MRSRWTRKVLASAGTTLLLGAIGFAQTATTDEGKRKVKTRVAPAYPELAKRMNVTGKVKIEVIIAPDATEAAKSVLAKKKNLRLLLTGGIPDPASGGTSFKSIAGGFLLHSNAVGCDHYSGAIRASFAMDKDFRLQVRAH